MRLIRWIAFTALGSLATGLVLLGAGPAQAASSCPQGASALSNHYFKIVDPITGTHFVGNLTNNVSPGDTVSAKFTVVSPLPTGCSGVQLTLSLFRSPYSTFSSSQISSQALLDSATGFFTAGQSGVLTLQIPPQPTGNNEQVTITNSSMEGALIGHPGEWLSAGYDFTMPGSHPATSVKFLDPTVTFPYRCSSGGAAAGSFTIFLPSATYSVPAGSSAWFPTGSNSAAVGFQGAIHVPDVCNGGAVYMNYGGAFGASFGASIDSTSPGSKINVRFHYRDPKAKGRHNINCSDPAQNPGANGNAECGASESATISATPTHGFQIDFSTGFVLLPPDYARLAPLDFISGDFWPDPIH